MILIEEIKDVYKRLGALHQYLKIEQKIIFVDQEQLKTQRKNTNL